MHKLGTLYGWCDYSDCLLTPVTIEHLRKWQLSSVCDFQLMSIINVIWIFSTISDMKIKYFTVGLKHQIEKSHRNLQSLQRRQLTPTSTRKLEQFSTGHHIFLKASTNNDPVLGKLRTLTKCEIYCRFFK